MAGPETGRKVAKRSSFTRLSVDLPRSRSANAFGLFYREAASVALWPLLSVFQGSVKPTPSPHATICSAETPSNRSGHQESRRHAALEAEGNDEQSLSTGRGRRVVQRVSHLLQRPPPRKESLPHAAMPLHAVAKAEAGSPSTRSKRTLRGSKENRVQSQGKKSNITASPEVLVLKTANSHRETENLCRRRVWRWARRWEGRGPNPRKVESSSGRVTLPFD